MTQWGLDTLFNPAKRHMDEEKRRLQSTREEIGDSSGGKRIDLESGKVVISRGNEDTDATDDQEEHVDTEGADDRDDADGRSAADSADAAPAAAGKAATEDPGRARPARSVTAKPTKPTRSTRTKATKPARQSGEPTAAEQRAAARRGRQPR